MPVAPGELYTPLKPDRQETSFFTLFPAGDKQDPVQGTIEVGSLEAPPQYEAISWYWGDATIMGRIMVNDTEFHVPRNMYEALIHMRLPDRPRCLWTDAVCLNQPDLKERASQIAMMGDIYRYSRCKLVWLGPFTSPYVLRPIQDKPGCYHVRTEIYVHGIMDGEAVRGESPIYAPDDDHEAIVRDVKNGRKQWAIPEFQDIELH